MEISGIIRAGYRQFLDEVTRETSRPKTSKRASEGGHQPWHGGHLDAYYSLLPYQIHVEEALYRSTAH